MEGHMVNVVAGIAVLLFNGGILMWMFRKMVVDIEKVKDETDEVRLNYLARFDDVKDIMNANHLDIVQRMIKLETLFKQTQR
jgi:hypothetical protein